MPTPPTGPAVHPLRAATASLACELVQGLSMATHLVGSVFGTASAAPGRLLSGSTTEPVLLVHGLGADNSCFGRMERHLHREGYTVYAANYSCVGADIATCGTHLARQAAWLRDETGSPSASVVAHSLGGLVLRWAMAHTWMRDWVDWPSPWAARTRALPPPAWRPPHSRASAGSSRSSGPGDTDRPLDESLRSTARWVAIGADHDWVVPAKYARLPGSENVRNVTVPRVGHLTLPNSRHCWQIILEDSPPPSKEGGHAGGVVTSTGASAVSAGLLRVARLPSRPTRSQLAASHEMPNAVKATTSPTYTRCRE